MDFTYVPSTCPYCGTGCGINLVVKDGQVRGISPWQRNPVNEGKVCIRGNKSFEFVNNGERITAPMIKKDGTFVQASWDDACREIAGHLKGAKGDEVAFIASGRVCNEDNFLFRNLGADVVRTPNIDYCGRRCNAAVVKSVADALGTGAMTNPISDISTAKAILVVGANPLEENPLAGRRIILAQKNGAKVIVIDARTTSTAKIADLHIACNPGTEVAFVMGLMNSIIGAGEENKDFIAKRTRDFEKVKSAVAPCNPDAVAKMCGVDAGLVAKAKEIYAAAPAMVITSAGAAGEELAKACVDLQLLTGNVGRAGAGIALLRGKSNGQGAMDMGCVPAANGQSLPQMIDSVLAGKIKTMYVMGENVAAGGAKAVEALGKLSFLVVQDMFMTETARMANVILPSASFAERDGTFTNSERRIQRVRKAVEPQGSARADWQIICDVAKALGAEKDFTFKSAEEVFTAITKAVPSYAGMSYAALEKPEAVQWPAAGGKFGTAVLYADKFGTADGKAAFAPPVFKAPEAPSAEFPFMVAPQWPMGTLSRMTPSIVREFPEATVIINKDDAQSLGIGSGQKVTVTGKSGSATFVTEVTTAIKQGVVSFPLAYAEGTVKIVKEA